MGWKPGKYLKKAFKGVKKVFKKVGKGIKSAFGKIGKFFGKFGVLGQIGMMMLMGPLGNMLGGMLSGAMGTLGTWSAGLIQNGGWAAKALGHTLKAIHSAGTFAGKVYTTISDGIGNAVDRTGNFFRGNGFTLSEGRAGIFDFTAQQNNPRSLLETGEYDVISNYGKGVTPTTTPLTTPEVTTVESTNISDVPPNPNKSLVDNDIAGIVDGVPDLTPDGIKIGEVNLPGIQPEDMLDVNVKPDSLLTDNRSFYDTVKEDGFISAIGDTVREGIDDFKNITPDQIAENVTSRAESIPLDGITMAATQDIAKSYGWEVGNQYVNSFNLMDIPESKTTGAVFNEIDYMANQSGNTYYGDMFANASTFLPESLIANENGYAEAWQQRNANLMYESDNIHRAMYGYGV